MNGGGLCNRCPEVSSKTYSGGKFYAFLGPHHNSGRNARLPMKDNLGVQKDVKPKMTTEYETSLQKSCTCDAVALCSNIPRLPCRPKKCVKLSQTLEYE